MSNSESNDDQLNPSKRRHLEEEEDLTFAMLCNVCRDLPHPETFYKCRNGHLLCDVCYSRIHVYGFQENMDPRCPSCRVSIADAYVQPITARDSTISRVLRSLGTTCLECEQKLTYDEVPEHKDKCIKRNVDCEYRCLGCEWRGPYNDSDSHKETCDFINKCSDEILAALDGAYEKNAIKRLCHSELSSNRILYRDIYLSECTRVDDNFTFYESLAIEGFEEIWRLVLSVDYGTIPGSPQMTYRLLLITEPMEPIEVAFFLMTPVMQSTGYIWPDMALERCTHTFSQQNRSSRLQKLKLDSDDAAFQFLVNQPIRIRLWIMLH